jgi:thiol-disulfide isomerase/thioredoxin
MRLITVIDRSKQAMNFRRLLLSFMLTGTLSIQAQRADSIGIYVFMSETCPICQSITIELKELYAAYHDKGVEFEGLFPNTKVSTDVTRRAFEAKYHIPFLLYPDTEQRMAKRFAATTTPQVFVVRIQDNAVLYSGKIDNSFESLGRRRTVVTQHYLRDALDNILSNKSADPLRTTPVGCYIQTL